MLSVHLVRVELRKLRPIPDFLQMLREVQLRPGAEDAEPDILSVKEAGLLILQVHHASGQQSRASCGKRIDTNRRRVAVHVHALRILISPKGSLQEQFFVPTRFYLDRK